MQACRKQKNCAPEVIAHTWNCVGNINNIISRNRGGRQPLDLKCPNHARRHSNHRSSSSPLSPPPRSCVSLSLRKSVTLFPDGRGVGGGGQEAVRSRWFEKSQLLENQKGPRVVVVDAATAVVIVVVVLKCQTRTGDGCLN